MKIACDFDGVICKREGIPTKEDWTESVPMPGAKEAIKMFIKLGHEVWVFTSNPDRTKVKSWLNLYNFPELEITNIKKPCHIIIDDRAIRFTSWQDIRKYIN